MDNMPSQRTLRHYHYLLRLPAMDDDDDIMASSSSSCAQLRALCEEAEDDDDAPVQLWVHDSTWHCAKSGYCYAQRALVVAWDSQYEAFALACGSYLDLSDKQWWLASSVYNENETDEEEQEEQEAGAEVDTPAADVAAPPPLSPPPLRQPLRRPLMLLLDDNDTKTARQSFREEYDEWNENGRTTEFDLY